MCITLGTFNYFLFIGDSSWKLISLLLLEIFTAYIYTCRETVVISFIFNGPQNILYLAIVSIWEFYLDFHYVQLCCFSFYLSIQPLCDGVHPKTPRFSTRYLIWVNNKVVRQKFQLIYLAFSYLNSVRHFQALNCVVNTPKTSPEKINLQLFCYELLAFFNNAHFHIYFSW